MTNQLLINRFLNSLRRSGKSLLTLSAYASDLKQFIALLGKKPLKDIDGEDLARYAQSLAPLTPNSQARKFISVRELLKWAHDHGYLRSDLRSAFKMPRRKSALPARPLSKSQVTRLRRHADVRERLLLELLLQTGMRLSEIVGLKMKHLNFNKRSRVAGRIPMTEPLEQTLEYYLAEHARGPKSSILTSPTGRPLSSRVAAMMLGRLARKALVRGVTARNLRATCIVRQLAAGVPVETVSQFVSLSIATLSRYRARSRPSQNWHPGKLVPV